MYVFVIHMENLIHKHWVFVHNPWNYPSLNYEKLHLSKPCYFVTKTQKTIHK
jgi:hypothetical protein